MDYDRGPWNGQGGQNQGYGQPPYGQPPYGQPPRPENNGFATASVVLGILSLVGCCCGYAGVIAGGLGVMFALLSRGEEPMGSRARVGLILSVAGMVLGVIVIIGVLLMVIIGGSIGGINYR